MTLSDLFELVETVYEQYSGEGVRNGENVMALLGLDDAEDTTRLQVEVARECVRRSLANLPDDDVADPGDLAFFVALMATHRGIELGIAAERARQIEAIA